MLTLALHHDESVFVYLSEAKKGKNTIEQLGLFPPDFSFDSKFLHQENAGDLFRDMLKEILDTLSLEREDLYFSFSAELTYISLYPDVPKADIQELVDRDIWLTEMKFGAAFIEERECQVKVSHSGDGRVSLTCIYYPELILEMMKTVCAELSCELKGMGITLFNASEVAKHSTSSASYLLVFRHRDMYEVMDISNDSIRAYARFSPVNGNPVFFARSGSIPDEVCKALCRKDGTELGDREMFVTGSSRGLEDIKSLSEGNPNIHMLNPMRISTANYTKPAVAYDKRYDTVFSSALGALI